MKPGNLRRSVQLVTSSLLIGSATLVASEAASRPTGLSSLKNGCTLELRESGRTAPTFWIVCQECEFRLLGLANLEGRVTIRTREQALEFVRIFSKPDTWYLSAIDRMIEVTAGTEPDEARFIVSEAQFAECCVPATVTVRETPEGSREFTVRRTIVEPDYRVYALTEMVVESGAVWVLEKKLLREDGNVLGWFFNPYIM